MKGLKNLFCSIVLSLIVVVSIFSVPAKATTENLIEDKKPITYEEQEVLKVNKNGETESLNRSDRSSVIQKSKQLFNNNIKSEINYNNPLVKQENNVVNVPVVDIKDNNAKTSAKTPSLVTMSYLTTYDPNKKTITTKIAIKNIVGEKPVVIEASNDLYTSNTYSGKYQRVFIHSREFLGANIKVGKSYSKSYSVKSTKFYISRHTTVAGWKGSLPDTSTGQLAPTLANKIGEIYPAIINHHNNKMLPLPSRADLPKVPEKDRVDWDSSKDRGAYIKKYIDTYGNPKWDWSAIDIHHVIPRERGGNNSFNNLYPLPRTMHQQLLNPWWARY